jgi:hypothetical protein
MTWSSPPLRPGALARAASSGLACLVAVMLVSACGPAKEEAISSADVAGRWMLDTHQETEWFNLRISIIGPWRLRAAT